MIFDLSKTDSFANICVAELRDQQIQQDAMRFRRNLERLGEFFAWEISKTLTYISTETQTPLGIAQTKKLETQPVLATILRAGLPMQQGLLNIFDRAESAFITAYRKTHVNGPLEIQVDHISAPDLTGKVAIDEEMTTKSYIVPGLGDAGDLAYGTKL